MAYVQKYTPDGKDYFGMIVEYHENGVTSPALVTQTHFTKVYEHAHLGHSNPPDETEAHLTVFPADPAKPMRVVLRAKRMQVGQKWPRDRQWRPLEPQDE